MDFLFLFAQKKSIIIGSIHFDDDDASGHDDINGDDDSINGGDVSDGSNK